MMMVTQLASRPGALSAPLALGVVSTGDRLMVAR
ncbi:hypothetical protein FHW79_001688 [Azospirillum sp. OGB3]|nr:hypothetical protein [Azospirillum sp. OGB3]